MLRRLEQQCNLKSFLLQTATAHYRHLLLAAAMEQTGGRSKMMLFLQFLCSAQIIIT